jgi:histidine triad (HIT) family protein
MLFRLARSRFARAFIGWIFAYMSFVIPVHRLRETKTLLAFYHPSPSYPFHVLIVPKRAVANLMELQSSDADFMVDLFSTVQSLVKEFELEARGYRLISNGGEYQDVPLLHFHLISDAPIVK